jgi:phage gp45-like
VSEQYIGNDLTELIKHLGKEQRNRWTVSCEGLITSVDPKTYMAKVMLMPWEIETGWLPIGTIAVGPQWGVFHLPPDNTEVLVTFVGGNVDNGRILLCYGNHVDAPPDGIVQGEIVLKHSSGSLLHFKQNGDVNLVVAGDLNAVVQGDTNISALGDLTSVVQGDATITAQGDCTAIAQGDLTLSAGGNTSVSASGPVALSSAAGIELNGPVTFTVPSGGTATFAIDGNLSATITGALAASVTGNATISSSGSAAITGSHVTVSGSTVAIGNGTSIDGYSFIGHTHTGVTPGSGSTGPVA